MTRVAISQSNYIPWIGYFDLMASVDHFILYDDMQYTRRDWRNRNKIGTPQGAKWLTVPVEVKGRYHQSIRETQIADESWALKHWRTLEGNYSKSPYFRDVATWLKPLYLDHSYSHLSVLNRTLLTATARYLGINTEIGDSADFELISGKSERLADLCQQMDASVYVSGPAAREYLDLAQFSTRGVAVSWFEYPRYSNYPQQWGDFVYGLSIVDLMFNLGRNTMSHFESALL